MAVLRLVPAQGDAIEIRSEKVLVGRDKSADITIADNSVSRRHATIERYEGGWLLSDQGSANGTFLNGTRITKALLAEGQTVQFGAVPFTVSLQEGRARVAVPIGSASAKIANPVRPQPIPVRPQPASPPPARAGQPAQEGMTAEDAAAILGLYPGSPPHEVRRQYQRLYNDLQIRLTNAPAPSLKKMYQKNLQDLKAAAELLCPGQVF